MKNIANHIFRNKVRLFEAAGQEKLEDAINDFGKDHDIVSVHVNASDHCLVGSGTIRPSDYVLVWYATVVYRFDVTEKEIQREIQKHLNDKVSQLRADFERKSQGDYCVRMLILKDKSVEQYIGDQLDAYKLSDEYKQVRENIRKSHETRQGRARDWHRFAGGWHSSQTKDEFEVDVASLGEGAKIVFAQEIEKRRKHFAEED